MYSFMFKKMIAKNIFSCVSPLVSSGIFGVPVKISFDAMIGALEKTGYKGTVIITGLSASDSIVAK